MGLRYLLDTNIASYIIKGDVPAVKRRLVRVPISEIAISSVTEGELHYGVAKKTGATRLRAIVEEFLLRVTVLPWDSDADRSYGNFRALLEREGRPMGNLDMMIGAHAIALGLILVTSDRVFRRVKALQVEDWASS